MSKIVHPVVGEVKEVDLESFLVNFDEEIFHLIEQSALRYPNAQAIVCLRVEQMGSPAFGHTQALVVGPSNTWTLETVCTTHFRTGDVPSQFHYPHNFVRLPLTMRQWIDAKVGAKLRHSKGELSV